MKSAAIALSLAVVAAVGVPAAGGDGAGVCEQLTPQRLIENPRFASRWSDAIRSGDPRALEQMNEAVSRLREMHGCDGGAAPGVAPDEEAPPDHALPPGHPPAAGGDPGSVVFEEPSTVTI